MKTKLGIIILIFLLLIITIIALALIDKTRCNKDKMPLFTIFTIYYKDGGTQYKIGIGYAIVIWNQLAVKTINSEEITGINIGKEFIGFPDCYINMFTHDIKPKIILDFIPQS